ncbi:MAG: flagellar biosynthesis protein [Burkholderiaceae bacterium]|nr:flagellar biosynthesis protein [Burkholderiaceae bacterium]
MTSSSDRGGERRPPGLYSRFIPREELAGFASWQPGSFGDDPARKPRTAPPAPDPELLRRQAEAAERERARRAAEAAAQAEADRIAALEAARRQGYQDGYRDGTSALEAFKSTFAAQTGSQVASVVQRLHEQLDALEQDLAQRVAGIALEIARQALRSELRQRPETVVAAAQEALGLLLRSARQATLRVHPDDHALVAQGCADLLAARGVQLVADAAIEAGGCLLESDIGTVDAQLATRWRRAAAAIGRDDDWQRSDAALAPEVRPS